MEAGKTSEDVNENTKVTFSVTASIMEGGRAPGSVSLKFSVNVDTQPAGARLFVAGTATVTGKDEELEGILDEKDNDGVPTVFMAIYKRAYAIMYLLSETLKIPHPAPGLLKVNFAVAAPEAQEPVAPAQEKKEDQKS